jgi:hypothetical protein
VKTWAASMRDECPGVGKMASCCRLRAGASRE